MGRHASLASAVEGGATTGGAGVGGGFQLPSQSHQSRATEALCPYEAPPPPHRGAR